MEPQMEKRGVPEEFVTVVNVQPTPPAESFVTVLSIGTGDKQSSSNGIVDPAHPEEEVEVYRLPGERLGFGLKFEGGNKTSEKVRRLFIQSCAEQSPASRAKCSWGNLGEGDEVLSIDEVPVTEMTRLDCVRRLKESQLVLKLMVRHRGALRPEVVSAERKLSGQQQPQAQKVPPELPAAPPPVPPRKLRHSSQAQQTAANRGLADGEASPGAKQAWDSPKSGGSSQTGSPQSQGSFRSAASSVKSSNYESCASSPAKSCSGSKHDSPKDSPKVHISPLLNKTKQEPPAEAQSYLDARSQDGSSTHGSTSDDTSSSLSTVVDRFSCSDRFSTTSTASTTSEQLFHTDNRITPVEIEDTLLDLNNPADFLLTRLANSEARTHVESRGDVERVTAVVAPNTVLIEETPTLQPPLSFQDAPLSYGHEPRPGIFYSVDLAADSRTHFRPIKDDADVVDKVFNGDAKEEELRIPVLPVRSHVNRISINQQQKEKEDEPSKMPMLPPKPMPRKDVKAKRKRPPPPPPPPPRREPPTPISEAKNLVDKKEDDEKNVKSNAGLENGEVDITNQENIDVNVSSDDRKKSKSNEQNANERIEGPEYKTNKVLEIVEMKKAKALSPQKPPSRASDEYEVPERGLVDSANDDSAHQNDVELRNCLNRKLLVDNRGNSNTISIELDNDSEDEMIELVAKEIETNNTLEIVENDAKDEELKDYERESILEEIVQFDADNDKDSRLIAVIRDHGREVDEDDLSDESDGDDYYWQSNLATIGEEEENNSLEYENANEDPLPPLSKPLETPQIIENIIESSPDTLEKNALDEPDCVSRIARDSGTEDKKQDKKNPLDMMEECSYSNIATSLSVAHAILDCKHDIPTSSLETNQERISTEWENCTKTTPTDVSWRSDDFLVEIVNDSSLTDTPNENNFTTSDASNLLFDVPDAMAPTSTSVNKLPNDFTDTSDEKETEVPTGQKHSKQGSIFQKALEKYSLKPPCGETCRFKCATNFSPLMRASINEAVVKLPWSQKRSWIVNHVKAIPIKRRRVEPNTSTKAHQNHYKYLMPNEENADIQVCKCFFLATLGFSRQNDKVIRNALSNVEDISMTPIMPDRRGKSNRPATAVTNDVIKHHIESFNPSVSHYRRAHAPKRRYLPNDLTVTDMHKDFLEKHPHDKISYERYRKTLADLNISFAKLGNEECENCESFFRHNPAHTKDNLCSDCKDCENWSSHNTKFKIAREKYQDDVEKSCSSSDTLYFSADLQKVIMLPKMDAFKIVMFTRRIVAFNMSFVPLGSSTETKQPIAVIWNEGIAGRKCEDITSAFHKFFLTNRDAKHIVLWLDNCSAQNKNWCLFTFLIQLINSDDIETTVIELKYFESGHTFMSADSFHHQVELSLKKMGNVYDFDDFHAAVQKANSGKVNVKSMKPDDFTKWLDRSSMHKMKKKENHPRIRDMKVIQFKRGNMNLFYKLSLSASHDEAIELDFLIAKVLKNGFPDWEKQKMPRGVTSTKKKDIIDKLLPLMPRSRRAFWHSLPSCDVKDLIDEYDNETEDV